jgi:hypothetical protein
MKREPNPVANFDPSCVILVETSPDPDAGASTALTVAVCDGYTVGSSWLVTGKDGEQSIVVLLTRPSRVGVAAPHPAAWQGRASLAALAAVSVVGWCLAFASVLR